MSHLPSSLATPVAMVPLAAAAAVIAVGLVKSVARPRTAAGEFAAAFALGLELLLAAGLVRLAAGPTLKMLGLVALIIAVRRVAGSGLRSAARAGSLRSTA